MEAEPVQPESAPAAVVAPAPWPTAASVSTPAPDRAPLTPKAKELVVADVEPAVIAGGRPCPDCGIRNSDGAAFCWQCYRSFVQPAMRANMAISATGPTPYTSSTGSPLNPVPESYTPAPMKASRRAPWSKIAIAVAVAVAIFAGKMIWENSNRTHLQVPAAIGGMQLIDDPRLGEAVQTLEKIASDNGSAGKAGFYGFSGVPSFFFAALEFHSGDLTPDALFSEFSGSFASSGSKSVIDLGSKTSSTVGEATFICAKVKGKPSGSICMWTDSEVIGFVGAFGQGVNKAQILTAAVRTSVEN